MKYLKINLLKDREEKLLNFLMKVDKDFEIPLSARVNLKLWSQKLLKQAEIFVVIENEQILGIIAIYQNDLKEMKAYIPLLAVIKENRGKGLGKQLIKIALENLKNQNFLKIYCHTQSSSALRVYLNCNFKIISKDDDVYFLKRDLLEYHIEHKTIIQKLNYKDDKNNFFIKREDLLPFSFGGNKVRIADELILDLLKNKYNCVISYGNIKSNLNRIITNFAKLKNIPCYIVSPEDNNMNNSLNRKLSLLNISKENIIICSKNEVEITIKNLIKKLKLKGLNPYYINGSSTGKGNERVLVKAYKKVYQEIIEYEICNQVYFDYIFLATGTGMTQAGLICGKLENNDINRKIVGISIARNSKKGIEELQRYILADKKNEKNILFEDSYLVGGYGKYNDKIVEIIFEVFRSDGIALDTTYTGKGFLGMVEYLKENNIEDKNILFLHTGGLPLFFDDLNIMN